MAKRPTPNERRRKAALKGWTKRRAESKVKRPLESARNALLGYRAPAAFEVIPKGDSEADIRYFHVAIFRPSGSKNFQSKDVLRETIERINAVIPGSIRYRSKWQATIRLPRNASTATLARLLENADFDGLNLQRGRMHLAVGTKDAQYLPLTGGFGVPNDALVYAVSELLDDVMKYRSRMEERS